MKRTVHRISWKDLFRSAVAFLAIMIAAASAVLAKPRPGKPKQQPVAVVAHVGLSGGPATRMLLVEKGGREYLYVGRNSPEGWSIVDVSKPDHPRVLDRPAGSSRLPTGNLSVVGDTRALIVTSEEGTTTAKSRDRAPESVTVLDFADPSNPREIRAFSGVTSFLTDDERGLIYVANPEGLWIVKAKQNTEVPGSDSQGG
jgi:hypothetical protein